MATFEEGLKASKLLSSALKKTWGKDSIIL